MTEVTMFRKLRNRLVAINCIITTIILAIAFSMIYFLFQNSTMKRPIPPKEPGASIGEEQGMVEKMRQDRQTSLDSLLVSLIAVSAVVELAVVVVSYAMAEVSMRPVREAYERQKIFIANASHEIKTPLAAIAANLEAANIQDNRWIDNAMQEVQALAALNTQLLTLTRADEVTDESIKIMRTDVRGLLTSSTEEFEAAAKRKKIKIHCKVVPEDAWLETNPSAVKQILGILLDNAVKYGKYNIWVGYKNRQIEVKNDGTSIPTDQLSRVFERFYQVDKTADGSGLGLAIAKEVADRNSWDLDVTSAGGETIFRLKL